jgi:hypothetical protein
MAILPHLFAAWLYRLCATQRCSVAVGPPIDRAPFYGRKSRRCRQNLTFDLLACLRKGTGVRRNILRQKIG